METAVITPSVVEGPPVSLLSKIESFLNDSQYRETIESSANYNTRLCIERRLRMPFLDSQTGMAQNHSNLFMSSRQRMPGFIQGQIYTYPSKRWRKKRRQYLTSLLHANRTTVTAKEVAEIEAPEHFHTISTVENPAAIGATDEASKDSMGTKDEPSKDAWYYDDLDMHEMDPFDEPDLDSDYDYEESYRKKKKRPSKTPRSSATESPHSKKAKTPGPGRGRKKGMAYSELTDSDKPFSCDICGARYKTRPGLSYHFTHTHKDKGPEDEEPKQMVLLQPQQQPPPPQHPQQMQQQQQQPPTETPKGKGKQGSSSGKSNVMTAPTAIPPVLPPNDEAEPLADNKGPGSEVPMVPMRPLEERKNKAAASPYCDFCLGDETENKKTHFAEELVSCSDCGRSGHPTCLQFTANMIISVRKYRWQCIECKCCSVCGTSDNDDQLLFCDDCDRGYHMYCLSPPLTTPPEGSWSCRLCLHEFHKK